jgi:hypothetical protein
MNCRRLRCDDCRVAGGLCLICGWIRRPMMPQSRAFTRTRRNTACGIQHLRTSRRSPILGDVLCSASAQLPAETRDPDGAIPTTCGGARGRTLPGAALMLLYAAPGIVHPPARLSPCSPGHSSSPTRLSPFPDKVGPLVKTPPETAGFLLHAERIFPSRLMERINAGLVWCFGCSHSSSETGSACTSI